MRVHHIENVNKVIAILNEHGVRKRKKNRMNGLLNINFFLD